MKKNLTADFSKGNEKAYVRGLYQHDYGAILKVTGIEYTEIIRVDFAGPNDEKAHPVVVLQESDGDFCVKIPKENTDKAGELSAYIYVTDAEAGFTIKEVILPIIGRVEADPDPSGEKTDPFAEAIEEIKKNAKSASDSAASAAESEKSASESATRAEKSAVESQESAQAAATSGKAAATSATAAAQSASQSRESATAAQTAADQAGKSATSAAESANTATQQAENAAQSATNAARSAESAAQSAETAKTAADTAKKSASAAQQAVRSAAESASTATAAAQTATTAAGNAAESVTLANQSAETAGQKATAAETSASNAAESATAAEKSATAAGDSASAAKTSETAAGEAAQTAQEQAEKIKDSAEQIEKNKAGVAALEEGKADKTTLAVAERKLDALWKLNQGVSYQFEEDSTEAYQKTVPTGAKLASVKRIGGKTIVWNQLLNYDTLESGLTGLNRWYDVSNDDGIYTLIAKNIANRVQQIIQVKSNHIYLMKAVTNENSGNSVEFCPHSYENPMTSMVQCYNKGEGWKKIYQIIKVGYTGKLLFQFYLNATEYPATMQYKSGSFLVFDLTQMFGSGNEPTTVEAFEAMFPEKSYPHNAGELMSAPVSEVIERGRNLIDARKVVSKTGDVNFENLGNGKIYVHGSTNTRSEIDEIYVDEKDFPVGRYRINNTGNSGISITFVKKNKATGKKTWCNDKFEITDNDTPLYWYIMAVKCTVDTVITPQITAGDTELPTLVYHNPVSFAVPEAVRQLPGYGWSAGNVCNEVDWESKKYIQRIGHYEFSENTAVRLLKNNYTDIYCAFFASAENVKLNIAVNGIRSKNFASKYIGGNTNAEGICCETTGFLEYKVQFEKLKCAKEDDDDTIIAAIKKYMTEIAEEAKYPLVEPIITDISDLIDNAFQEPFEVESGGTLTFQNSHDGGFQIPVPSEEEYIVSLTEVGGVTE